MRLKDGWDQILEPGPAAPMASGMRCKDEEASTNPGMAFGGSFQERGDSFRRTPESTRASSTGRETTGAATRPGWICLRSIESSPGEGDRLGVGCPGPGRLYTTSTNPSPGCFIPNEASPQLLGRTKPRGRSSPPHAFACTIVAAGLPRTVRLDSVHCRRRRYGLAGRVGCCAAAPWCRARAPRTRAEDPPGESS